MNIIETRIYRHLNTHPYYADERWYKRLDRLRHRYPREFRAVEQRIKESRTPN